MKKILQDIEEGNHTRRSEKAAGALMIAELVPSNEHSGKTSYTLDALVEDCARFLKDYYWNELLEFINYYPSVKSFYISIYKIVRFNKPFGDLVIDNPTELLEALKIAICKKIDYPFPIEIEDVTVRIRDLWQNKVSIHAFRENHIEQLVAVEGIVRKATNVEAIYAKTAYMCLRCGHVTVVQQPTHAYVENRMEEPFGGCEGKTCGKKGPFKIRNKLSSFVDFQRIQLQEPPESIQNGGQPQSLEVVMVGDITGDVFPGNRVIITGILNAINVTSKDGRTVVCKYVLYANSIEHIDKSFRELEIS